GLAGVLGERGKEWQRSRGTDPELRAGRPDAAEIERGAPEVDIEARDVEGTNGDGLDSRRPERDVVAARATDGAADEPGGGPGLVVACRQVDATAEIRDRRHAGEGEDAGDVEPGRRETEPDAPRRRAGPDAAREGHPAAIEAAAGPHDGRRGVGRECA